MNTKKYVITFVAPDRLPPELLAVISSNLIDFGATEIDCNTFDGPHIGEMTFRGGDIEKTRVQLALLAEAHTVDIILQLAAKRRKRLLVADMESTIIEQEMIDELAAILGCGAQTAAITRRSMNGEIDFTSSLRERVALLKGQPVSLLDQAAKCITPMPGAEALIRTMRKNDAQCWLVTGGFGYFAQPVARRLGFHRVCANELIIKDGILTGEVAEPILDRKGKQIWLEKARAELGIAMNEAMAVGDGANDLDMLTACNSGDGLGVAFRAKPKVRAAVPHQINYTDLSTLLYAQGLEF